MTGAELSARSRAKSRANKPRPTSRVLPDLKFARLVPGPLTAQIKSPISFVRRFIDERFPDLSAVSLACNRNLKRCGFVGLESGNARWIRGLVGTAIDYRVRAYFDRNVHKSSVVEGGLEKLTIFKKVGAIDNIWHRGRSERHANSFIESFEEFVHKAKPERRRLASAMEQKLRRYCVAFAYLDHINRSPFHNFPLLEKMVSWGRLKFPEMLDSFELEIVTDTIALSNKFYSDNKLMLQSFEKAVLVRPLTGSKT
jgi:hypothetical protein